MQMTLALRSSDSRLARCSVLELVSTIFVTTASGATSGGKVIGGTTFCTFATYASLTSEVMRVDLPTSGSPARTMRTSLRIVVVMLLSFLARSRSGYAL